VKLSKLFFGLLLLVALVFTGCPTEVALFSVTYDKGSEDATGSVIDTRLYAVGNAVPVLGGNALTLEGHKFVGWQDSNPKNLEDNSRAVTKYDSEGDPLFNEGSSFNMPASDVVLYAQWDSEDGYTINYNLDDGENSLLNPVSYYRDDADILLSNPTKSGFAFLGWYDQEEAGTQVTSICSADGGEIDLYARWEATTGYSFDVRLYEPGAVTYDDYELYETIHVYFGGTYGVPLYDEAIPTGYTNDGWYTRMGTTGGLKIEEDTIVSDETVDDSGNHTLYLRWIPGDYDVTFKANGGDGADYTQTFTFRDAEDLDANTFTRTGYNFDGWATTDVGVKAYDDEASYEMTTEGASLYALWTEGDYDVTFKANGGTGDDYTQTFTFNAAEDLEANTFTRTGYDFAGWATTSAGAKAHDDEASYTMTTEGADLYALWTANDYDVTFNANGGIGAAYTQTFTFDIVEDLDANMFTRTGYIFDGWATTSNGAKAYDDEDSYTLTTLGGDLYAVWTADEYDVTFDANGGTGADYTQSFTFGVAENLDANTFTRVGYTFDGWATTDVGVKAYDDEDSYEMTTEGADLYAKWTALMVTVTFDVKSGSMIVGSESDYSQEIPYDSVIANLPGANPKNAEYEFSHWIDADNQMWEILDLLNDDRIEDLSTDLEMTLEAVYTKII